MLGFGFGRVKKLYLFWVKKRTVEGSVENREYQSCAENKKKKITFRFNSFFCSWHRLPLAFDKCVFSTVLQINRRQIH